jgi:hypothetical protein
MDVFNYVNPCGGNKPRLKRQGHVSMLILLRASLSPSSLSAEALESYERDVDENSVVCH